ncbi:hypothetical protein SCHPADRAFT_946301 [Schizopora paradoxa]|uniref:Mid2 domain-containing protein n=1 Tax=Schizopora paradoxa TaxID=27342 RepID=A0A0H2RMV6_9AGAM|nr:hypothetical protein SCHPADRAFT_946301 [Schizopora paradoxa]
MLTNVSIDDASPDPLTGARIMYGFVNQVTPAGAGWNVGQNCSTCLAQPDPSQTFDGTWHDASTEVVGDNIPFASVSFTGVAIYVVGIIVSSTPETNSTEVVYSYNTTFLAKEGLSDGLHNVTMMCGTGDPSIDSVCLLDRFIYTTRVNSSDQNSSSSPSPDPSSSPSPSSSSSSSSETDDSQPTFSSPTLQPSASASSPNSSVTISPGVIVGAALGASLFLILLVVLYFLRRRHGRKHIVVPYAMSYSGQQDSSSDANLEPPSYTDIAGDTTFSSGPLSAGSISSQDRGSIGLLRKQRGG